MKCEYCFEPFDFEDKTPIKLKCSHLFCKECIKILEYTLTYCPIDNQKIDYKIIEVDQETVRKLNFTCPEHHNLCIGICFDHSSPICKVCKDSHSFCKIFKGTQDEIYSHISEMINSASIKYYSFLEQPNKSIFQNFDIFYNIDLHLKTLDTLCEKFERNELTQEQKEKFLQDINFASKIKIQFKSKENTSEALVPKVLDENLEKLNKGIFESFFAKNNKKDSKVQNELNNIIPKYYLGFFIQSKVNTQAFNKYFCNFKHSLAEFVFLNGCGIGCPSNESSSVYVSIFEIIVNDEKYSQDIGVLEFAPNKLCSKIMFDKIIFLKKDTEMLIHIEIEGTNNYLFNTLGFQKVSILDIDDKPYHEDFPLLYLTHSLD